MKRVAFLAAAALAVSSSCSFAVTQAVKDACSSDFAAYCSQHKVGTEAAKSCMREHRKMLTDSCIQALGHSNEVTQADIEQYKREHNKYVSSGRSIGPARNTTCFRGARESRFFIVPVHQRTRPRPR
jgi:hypothetical protein